jgi:hypothetical protein
MVAEVLDGFPEFNRPKPNSNHGNSGDMSDDFLLTREQWLTKDHPLFNDDFSR